MRKQLPVWAAIAVVVVLAIVLLAVTNMLTASRDQAALMEESAAAEAAAGTEATEGAEAPAEAASSEGAVVSGSAQGFGGQITVEVTLNGDGSIANVDIDAPSETAGIGTMVVDNADFAQQFVGKTSVEGIDTISGATISSEAVISAVEAALASAPAGGGSAGGAADGDAGGETVVSGSAQGFGGQITVEVTLNGDGSIASVAIDAPSETAGIGTMVVDNADFAQQFVGKTSAEGVDTISGATISSEAVISAVEAALASAQ